MKCPLKVWSSRLALGLASFVQCVPAMKAQNMCDEHIRPCGTDSVVLQPASVSIYLCLCSHACLCFCTLMPHQHPVSGLHLVYFEEASGGWKAGPGRAGPGQQRFFPTYTLIHGARPSASDSIDPFLVATSQTTQAHTPLSLFYCP